MTRDKIYISGPVSSRPLGVAINHFMLAEAKLQVQGYRTCNPIKMRFPVWLALHCGQFGYVACLLLQLLWHGIGEIAIEGQREYDVGKMAQGDLEIKGCVDGPGLGLRVAYLLVDNCVARRDP